MKAKNSKIYMLFEKTAFIRGFHTENNELKSVAFLELRLIRRVNFRSRSMNCTLCVHYGNISTMQNLVLQFMPVGQFMKLKISIPASFACNSFISRASSLLFILNTYS